MRLIRIHNEPQKKQINNTVLIEAAFILTSTTATLPFVAKTTSWYFHPYSAANVLLFANYLLRYVQDKTEAELAEWSKCTRSILFANFGLLYWNVLVHETGHALTSWVLYPDSSPQITLTPPNGGMTQFDIASEPSQWGDMLGEDPARAFIAAAGPVAELLGCYCCLIIAQVIPNHYVEIKSHLRLVTLFSVVSSVCYSLSAFWSCEPAGHDFCKLNEYSNLSSVIAACFILGSAVGLQLALSYCYPADLKSGNERIEFESTDNKMPMLSNSSINCFSFFRKTANTSIEEGILSPDAHVVNF